MGIPLSKLIDQIGTAVQNANAMLEQRAVAAYLGQGYEGVPSEEGGETEFEPVSYTINIPSSGGKKQLKVPVTALMHHSSLQLEQVDVKLRFVVEEGEADEIIVSPKSSADAKDSFSMSELSLQFKSVQLSEGTARINNHYIQNL
ncbi:MAG: DUF2589 domain-containing protein [Roseburia sp.]|nr:DUF2589 domain-containing protein [Roseburia sp.]